MSVPALPALSAALAGGELRAAMPAATAAPQPLPVEVEEAAPELDREQLAAAAAQANQRLEQKGVELAIEFDDELGRAIFRLVDSATGELVRQVPSEEMLAVARALAAGESAGALIKTRA